MWALVGLASACSPSGKLLPGDGPQDDAGVADASVEAGRGTDDASPGPGTGSEAGSVADGGAEAQDGQPPGDAAVQDDAAAPEAGPTDAGPAEGGVPSCASLAATCGPNHDEDCCASSLVEGGTFVRDDGVSGSYPATVSDFRLDRFEITVGRFRAFYAQYPGDPPAGSSGTNANDSTDPGWDPTWDGDLPADAGALDTAVECTSPSWQNWTVGDDTLPMNCISWYEAYAFCIWDHGRLPTEPTTSSRRLAGTGTSRASAPTSSEHGARAIRDRLRPPSPTATVQCPLHQPV